MGSTKVKLDSELISRAEKFAEKAGYGDVEEFITHIIERELARGSESEDDDKLKDKLRGLGYIS